MIVSNTKVSTAKDHGENYMKVRPPLVHHLQRNRLFYGLLSRYSSLVSAVVETLFSENPGELFVG